KNTTQNSPDKKAGNEIPKNHGMVISPKSVVFGLNDHSTELNNYARPNQDNYARPFQNSGYGHDLTKSNTADQDENFDSNVHSPQSFGMHFSGKRSALFAGILIFFLL